MRKYALETSPGADCENMRSAKIILSPYAAKAMYDKHRDWNWPQWTRARLLFGVATDETYREAFVRLCLPLERE